MCDPRSGLLAVVVTLAACSTPMAARDTGAAGPGDVVAEADAAGDAADAPESSRAACTFNSDCPETERCECHAGDCACLAGPRGGGRSGVDPCTTGEDCASALCVEDREGGYTCSGPCEPDAGACGPRLPECTYISMLGRICVRR